MQEPEQERIEAVEAIVSEAAPAQYRTAEASESAPMQYRTTDLDAESSEDEPVPRLGKIINHRRILSFHSFFFKGGGGRPTERDIER